MQGRAQGGVRESISTPERLISKVWQGISKSKERFPSQVVTGTPLCPLKSLESTDKQGKDRDKGVNVIPAHHAPYNVQFSKVLKWSEVREYGLEDVENHQLEQ